MNWQCELRYDVVRTVSKGTKRFRTDDVLRKVWREKKGDFTSKELIVRVGLLENEYLFLSKCKIHTQ